MLESVFAKSAPLEDDFIIQLRCTKFLGWWFEFVIIEQHIGSTWSDSHIVEKNVSTQKRDLPMKSRPASFHVPFLLTIILLGQTLRCTKWHVWCRNNRASIICNRRKKRAGLKNCQTIKHTRTYIFKLLLLIYGIDPISYNHFLRAIE